MNMDDLILTKLTPVVLDLHMTILAPDLDVKIKVQGQRVMHTKNNFVQNFTWSGGHIAFHKQILVSGHNQGMRSSCYVYNVVPADPVA